MTRGEKKKTDKSIKPKKKINQKNRTKKKTDQTD